MSEFITHASSGESGLVVVLGMHRSGTSAVTRALETMGVELGDNLMPPVEGVNGKGFYEDLALVALNEQLLLACEHEWDSVTPIHGAEVDRLCQKGYLLEALSFLRERMEKYPLFGMKDPRMAKLMPFWKRVFSAAEVEVRYVFAYRNPLSVVRSLAARDNFPSTKSFLLVADYMVTSLGLLRDCSVVMVDYDRLMQDPRVQLEAMSEGLELPLDQARVDEYCTEFLDAGMRHSRFAMGDVLLDPAAIALVKDIHIAVCDVLEGRKSLQELLDKQQVDAWQQELVRWRAVLQLLDEMSHESVRLQKELSVRESDIQLVTKLIHERDEQLHEVRLQQQRDNELHAMRVDELESVIRDKTELVEKLSSTVEQERAMREELSIQVEQEREIREDYVRTVDEIVNSTSWKLTRPIRLVGNGARTLRKALRLMPRFARAKGGYREAFKLAFRVWRAEGMAGVRARISGAEREQQAEVLAVAQSQHDELRCFNVAPYYVDPLMDTQELPPFSAPRVAIHLHLFYPDQLDDFLARFALIPCRFDLFVSVPVDGLGELEPRFRDALPRLGELVIEAVPNRGRDLAPLIVQFGKRLAEYDVIGHFHTKKSPHNERLANWRAELLDMLFGKPGASGGRIAHFFGLLMGDTKVIYPEGRFEFVKDATGWGDNYPKAKQILDRYSDLDIEEFPGVEFPEGGMFWARASCLKTYLELPIKFSDFEEEPIGADGSVAHALERLILIFSSKFPGRNLRIHQGDSIHDYSSYETQKDFSSSIVDKNIKVLAYYLPQFHPTPENDEWHGKGFTEWTKVRATNPLFEGHYQQHIPHSDIGYYLLDSPETLRTQAELMRQSGVYGQVFYHYWFGGRMILEKPAQMLLENKDIQMPFCFCWANENWTRRWDGNESEILLAQDYSANDAKGFIQYLIPFFRDDRYIHVDGRPVLFVYRASSIPDVQTYLDVWARECQDAGLQRPYVVAVLTRGATHPSEFGMDAGTERVLHDWTGGNAPEIKHGLHAYAPINGTVLNYDDVADYYCREQPKDFTYFRNIVPMWDNTARYGSEAYVVHGSTPRRFQQWFEHLIDVTRETLPADRQFILVNAWNEWAEGAHLEPDSRYGYSYLNSIGRALSGIEYREQLNPDVDLDPQLSLHVEFPPHLLEWLKADEDLGERFSCCLQSALDQVGVQVSVGCAGAEYLSGIDVGEGADADFILEIRKPAFFPPLAVRNMLKTAVSEEEAVVIANAYGEDEPLIQILDNGATSDHYLYGAPLVIRPKDVHEIKKVSVRADTHVFITRPCMTGQDIPEVTTLIRIHHKGELQLLHHSLACLAAMRDCVCVPLITAQDFSEDQKEELEQILHSYRWRKGKQARVIHFRSKNGQQDLRSKMLNEGLMAIETRYAAFLDYDDLLMNHAYSWLYQRLRQTGKAVAFGRVFASSYESTTGRFVTRSNIYEYGGSYEDFLLRNHAPLHSFLLDLEQIDLSSLVYHDEHKYMEDYYLTLQLFKEDNADWDSLRENKYVGDYIFSVDRKHTLAISCEQERQELLQDQVYMECEERIQAMRRRIRGS